jgi:hypothetical protein
MEYFNWLWILSIRRPQKGDEDQRTGINKCNLCKVESDKRYAPNFLARIPSLNKAVYDLKTVSMFGVKPQQ